MAALFLLASTEQIVLCRPDQFACAALSTLECEATHDTNRRPVKLAAYQARCASDLICDGFVAGVKRISMRATSSTIINNRFHARHADGNFGQAFAPGTSE